VNGPEESKPSTAPEASGKKRPNLGPRAPKPVTMLSGTGSSGFTPKASKVPDGPPDHFPKGLWSRTYLVLLEAQKEFSVQERTLELCKRVTSHMTPLFIEALKDGKIKADAVLTRYGGGMYDLLDSLLRENDSGVLRGEVMKSAEWKKLAEAIVDEEARRYGTNSLAGAQGQNEKDRHAMVDAYLAEVLDRTGKRITRKDFWKAAGYSNATEFERWQRDDPKANISAGQNFKRILETKPHLKPQK
jgi:hypothetical protein